MATRKGLEPSTSSVTGWHSKPTELPGRNWWAFRDLNPGPTGYEPAALTTELKALDLILSACDAFEKDGDPAGIRTRVIAVKGRCLDHLTTGPHFSFALRRLVGKNWSG